MNNNYQELLKSPLWQKKRLEVMQYHNWQCQLCGAKDKELQVHHPRYVNGRKPWEYGLDELMCLCANCHMRQHRIEKYIDAEIYFCQFGLALYKIPNNYDSLEILDLAKKEVDDWDSSNNPAWWAEYILQNSFDLCRLSYECERLNAFEDYNSEHWYADERNYYFYTEIRHLFWYYKNVANRKHFERIVHNLEEIINWLDLNWQNCYELSSSADEGKLESKDEFYEKYPVIGSPWRVTNIFDEELNKKIDKLIKMPKGLNYDIMAESIMAKKKEILTQQK